MKKLLLAIAMVAVGFTANAQGFEQEDLYVSGTLGYNSTKTTSSFSMSPSAGYFISDNIALEAGVTLGTSSNDGTTTNTSTFGIDLGAAYFFSPDENFSFTLRAGLSYDSVSTEVAGVDQPKRSVLGLGVSPGINYFVSESVALRASVGALSYTSTSVDAPGAASTSTFGLNLNLSNIGFGILYKF